MDKREASPWGEAGAERLMRGYGTRDLPLIRLCEAPSPEGEGYSLCRGDSPINPNLPVNIFLCDTTVAQKGSELLAVALAYRVAVFRKGIDNAIYLK